MATADTIPVTIAEEAAARIDEIGMQSAFASMLERAKQTWPGIRRIEVVLNYLVDEPETPPKVMIEVYRPMLSLEEEVALDRQWDQWILTLPPQVWLALDAWSVPEEADGR